MHEMLITWGVAALFGLSALWPALPMLRRWYDRWCMERIIASSGVEKMRNVLIDDGMGGQTFFEWLLLTPDTIRVLVTNGRKGIIFAGERLDPWAQVVGKRTIHFDNPLSGLEESMVTLRYHLPKPVIDGNILFTGDCSFPKGRPDKILMLKELDDKHKEPAQKPVQPALRQAWEKLRALARKVDPATESYLLPAREGSAGRWLLIVLLLVAAGAWLYWRYLLEA